jgi:flagellar basal-body rod protein FlgG
MQTLYTAKLGLQAQQQRVNTIGNNLANSQTIAYKQQRTDFKDALYTAMINPADTQSAANLQQGCGVLISSTPRSFDQGVPKMTGYVLDFYLDGDGFFTVSDSNGNLQYTRGGNFMVSNETDGTYLVTASGNYVLDTEFNRITLPENISDLTVSADGVLSAGNQPFAALNIVDFANKDGLQLVGGGCYIETAAAGAAVESDATVRQGVLEASNVDITSEMTRLIRAQRAFSLASRAVSAWNDMTEKACNLR